jgi:hypothetical protein
MLAPLVAHFLSARLPGTKRPMTKKPNTHDDGIGNWDRAEPKGTTVISDLYAYASFELP